MFKRDDHTRTQHDAVFPKWQGFARSMFLHKPFSDKAELRKNLTDYSYIPRELGPKIPVRARDREDCRKGNDYVGRYRDQGSFLGIGVAVIGHDQGGLKVKANDGLAASLGQTESIRSRLRSYTRSIPHHDLLKKLGDNELMSQKERGVSQSILPLTQKNIGSRTEDKKPDSAEEKEINADAAEEESNVLASILRLSRSRPQVVSDRPDDIADVSDSTSVCGVLLEDGTTCITTPIKGKKRCTDHKGQRISRVSPVKHIPCGEDNDDICGVILPDMVPCRSKPVSRRKRCEDHKGMRVNAFFFLFNPTERYNILKENKSQPETCKGMNEKASGPDLLCQAITKNGLPCTRNAPVGSRRCWQHKDKTLDNRSSENVQPATASQVSCGVKLYNGSVCEKSPVKGRKRCEEHKGMRITP
ncbi:unnamed protein product [Cochlearia groenlandica]